MSFRLTNIFVRLKIQYPAGVLQHEENEFVFAISDRKGTN